MKKLILLAATAALVVAAGPAAAKTVTIAITKSGYVPKTTSISVGDSVSFVNQDTVSHQVVLKPSAGVTCTPTGLALAPGQTGTCTFSAAGTYSFTDTTNKSAAFKGTITVTAAAGGALTIRVSPTLVTYGGSTTVSGELGSGQANQKVTILARSCGQSSFRQVGTATTAAGGSYSFAYQPTTNTTFMAKSKSAATTTAPSVVVRPQLVLRRIRAHRFSVRLTAAQSFVGKIVVFQRYSAARTAWVRVRSVTLSKTVPATAPTVVTVASFRSGVRRGLRVRAVLTHAQATPCYVAARSAAIKS